MCGGQKQAEKSQYVPKFTKGQRVKYIGHFGLQGVSYGMVGTVQEDASSGFEGDYAEVKFDNYSSANRRNGWYYADVQNLELVPAETAQPQCSRCGGLLAA